MSRSEGPLGPGRFDPCDCDPEKVFELVDGGGGPDGPDPEQERKMQEHLASCSRCRELYERELDLNAFLGSLDFSGLCSRSVSQGVAMALPTRSAGARILWGLVAGALLIMAFVSLEFNGTEAVTLAMSALSTCWGFVVGTAGAARAVFATAGPAILFVLALGALVDVFIALVVVSLSRKRRAQEA